MPLTLTAPGVYIEEVPSSVRTIIGVPTSVTAFVGRAWKGRQDVVVAVDSWAEYERTFGGLWQDSTLSYAVRQFFLNGGSSALVVRVASAGAAWATIDLPNGNQLRAASVGTWGRNLQVTVDHDTKDKNTAAPDQNLFNLTIVDGQQTRQDAGKRGGTGARETFLNVSRDAASPRFVSRVLEQRSELVRVVTLDAGGQRPAETANPIAADPSSGSDGAAVDAVEVIGAAGPPPTGMNALATADIFNLLCIPPFTPDTADNGIAAVWSPAAEFCRLHRALLIVDAPATWTVAAATSSIGDFSQLARSSAAIYFPRVRQADPLNDNALVDFAPCGLVAGIISRTDAERGIWKAPAGIEASLRGVASLSVNQTEATIGEGESGRLNPLGINAFRTFPNIGTVVWGARTLEGADILASQWKYVPVRRLALNIEESLYRGTQWVVFEPNDEPLWAQIRLNVGAFMHGLFRQGAFQGVTPRDAYLVKCDKETTTQNDIDSGVVNILVGFMPLKPAEFVVIRIQQMAGQIQT